VDGVAATQWINSLANDFDLWPRPWYDNPQARIGTATKAALDRLFGWKIVRVPLPGSAQNLFWWDDVTQPTRFPEGWVALVESMVRTDPCNDDDGQWYEWPEDSTTEGGAAAR